MLQIIIKNHISFLSACNLQNRQFMKKLNKNEFLENLSLIKHLAYLLDQALRREGLP